MDDTKQDIPVIPHMSESVREGSDQNQLRYNTSIFLLQGCKETYGV